MNKASIDRMLGLMVMAGWSRTQILNVISEMQQLHHYQLSDILDRVISASHFHEEEMRRSSFEFSSSIALESYSSDHSNDYNSNYIENEVYERIHESLISDLGLSTPDIVAMISEELNHRYDSHTPPLSKKSLRNWLSRLLNVYSASEILHAVTTIYNKHRGTHKIGWSIRD